MSDMSRSAIEFGPDGHVVEIPCPTCHGEGQVSTGAFDKHAEHVCPECDGFGQVDVDVDAIDDWDTRDHDVQKGDW